MGHENSDSDSVFIRPNGTETLNVNEIRSVAEKLDVWPCDRKTVPLVRLPCC